MRSLTRCSLVAGLCLLPAAPADAREVQRPYLVDVRASHAGETVEPPFSLDFPDGGFARQLSTGRQTAASRLTATSAAAVRVTYDTAARSVAFRPTRFVGQLLEGSRSSASGRMHELRVSTDGAGTTRTETTCSAGIRTGSSLPGRIGWAGTITLAGSRGQGPNGSGWGPLRPDAGTHPETRTPERCTTVTTDPAGATTTTIREDPSTTDQVPGPPPLGGTTIPQLSISDGRSGPVTQLRFTVPASSWGGRFRTRTLRARTIASSPQEGGAPIVATDRWTLRLTFRPCRVSRSGKVTCPRR